jgi:hypothetical protein
VEHHASRRWVVGTYLAARALTSARSPPDPGSRSSPTESVLMRVAGRTDTVDNAAHLPDADHRGAAERRGQHGHKQ